MRATASPQCIPTDRIDEAILVYMETKACHRERVFFGSQGRIAEAVGCSRRTVIRRMKRLEDTGVITRTGAVHRWDCKRSGMPCVTVCYRVLRRPVTQGLRPKVQPRTNPRYARVGERRRRMTDDLTLRQNTELAPITARDVLATTIDLFALDGIPLHARTKGILARQAKEGLESQFDPDTVLRACVIATRRGEPQNAWRVMGDLALLAAGKHMDRREYETELRAEKVRMTRKPNAVERFLDD